MRQNYDQNATKCLRRDRRTRPKDTPIEACGYLAGVNGEVKYAIPMNNTDASNEHFSFDPQEQFDAFKKTQKEGLRLISVYYLFPRRQRVRVKRTFV